MKKVISQTLGLLLAVSLLAGIGVAAWFGLEQLVALFAALDGQLARVTAIAAVVALLAAGIVACAVRQSGRDRLAVPLREEKAATYRLFVDCWQQRLAGEGSPEIEDCLNALDRMLALFGSEQVVSAHIALRALPHRSGVARAQGLSLLGGALLQIRQELKADKVDAAILDGLIASPERAATVSAGTNAAPAAMPAV